MPVIPMTNTLRHIMVIVHVILFLLVVVALLFVTPANVIGATIVVILWTALSFVLWLFVRPHAWWYSLAVLLGFVMLLLLILVLVTGTWLVGTRVQFGQIVTVIGVVKLLLAFRHNNA